MVRRPQSPDLLKDATVRTLLAGDIEAVFLPARGMLGASLRHRGVEILRRVEDLEAAAARGSSAGIPLLHPWANRLAGPRYRVLGQQVVLDVSSPFLNHDEHGLPMHGVPWSLLSLVVTEARQDFMAVFPFRHSVDLTATLRPDGLTLETTLVASAEGSSPGELRFSSVPWPSRAFACELAAGTTGDAEACTRQARDPDRS